MDENTLAKTLQELLTKEARANAQSARQRNTLLKEIQKILKRIKGST